MSGPVFHPGHHALHGVTVLVRGAEGRTYIGRFDSQDESGVHLLDVAVHEAADAPMTTDEFLRQAIRFGVRVDRKHVVVPSHEVERVTPLGEATGDG